MATGTGVAADPATIDPCQLLSAEQVGAAVAETVTAGVAREVEGRAICFYDVPAWPAPIIIPEDSGVSISVWREAKTISTAELYAAGSDQHVVTDVDGLGDGSWWTVHEELENVHINTENAALDVVVEPIQFRISFTQIPNPLGADKGEWLADATELAQQVLAALGG